MLWTGLCPRSFPFISHTPFCARLQSEPACFPRALAPHNYACQPPSTGTIFGSRRPPPGASNLSHSLDPWPLARLPRVPRVRADVRCGLHVPCGRRASESPLPACLRRQRPAPRLRPPSSLTACRSWSTSSAKWPGGRWWRWRSPPSCRAAGPTHLPDAPPPGRRAGAPASSTFPPR